MKRPRCCRAPTRKDHPRTKVTLGVGVHNQLAKLAYLTDILILDPAYLLNVRGALRDILQRVACELKFVFLVFRCFHVNAW